MSDNKIENMKCCGNCESISLSDAGNGSYYLDCKQNKTCYGFHNVCIDWVSDGLTVDQRLA